MGEQKISEMTPDASVTGVEILPASDGGVAKSVTVNNIKDFVIDQIEAISAASSTTGADSIFIMQGGVLKPIDIDEVVQYAIDEIWGKANEANPGASHTMPIKDGANTEKTVTLPVLAEYVRSVIESSILDVSDLTGATTPLSSGDFLLVTQGSTGKKVTVSDLNDAIYAALQAYVEGLAAVTVSTATDIFYCIQGGVEKQVTLAELSTYFGNPVAGPASTTADHIPQWADNVGTLGQGLALDTTIGAVGDNGSLSTTLAIINYVDEQLTTNVVDARFNSVGDGTMLSAAGVITGVVSLNGITAAELSQLANIDAAAIASIEWGYMALMDQGVATTDDVTFNSLTLTTSLSAVSLALGTDDSVQGSLVIYGDGTTSGGYARFHNAAGDDTTVEYYDIIADEFLAFKYGASTAMSISSAGDVSVTGRIQMDKQDSSIICDSGASRLALVKKTGVEPVIAAGSGANLKLGHWSTAAISGNESGGTFTQNLIFATSGYATFGTGTTGHSLSANGDVLVSGKLEVDGLSYFDDAVAVASALANIGTFTSTSANGSYLTISDDDGSLLIGVGGTLGTDIATGSGDVGIRAASGKAIHFLEAAATKMVIDGGNVGIGTASPWSKLSVGSGGTANPAADVSIHSGTASEYRLKLTSSLFNADGNWLGLGFGYSNNYMKAAIIAEAKDANGRANMHFVLDGAADAGNAGLIDAKATLTYGGNFGIGTTGPGSKLHVKSATGANCVLTIDTTDVNNATSDAGIAFAEGGGTKWYLYNDGDGSNKLHLQDDGDISMTWDQSGNVGIGTAAPVNLLHVHKSSAADAFISFTNTATGALVTDGSIVGVDASSILYLWNREAAAIRMGTSNAVRIAVDANGYTTFGAGTTSHSLGAAGDVLISGILEVNGAAYFDGGSLAVGVNDTTRGILYAFGDNANLGGLLRMYMGANRDTTYDYFDVGIIGSTDDLAIGANGAASLVVTGEGNVGIGTAAPVQRAHLHTASAADAFWQFSNTATGALVTDGSIVGINSAGALFLWNREVSSIFLGTSNLTRITVDSAGYTTFGAGTTGHALSANGDVLVSGVLEVDGVAWFDSSMSVANSGDATTYHISEYYRRRYVLSGSSVVTERISATYDQCLLGVSAGVGMQYVLTDNANVDKDHDHAVQTNPTLFVHSATDPDTNNTQWVSLTHDVTDGLFGIGTGKYRFDATADPFIKLTESGVDTYPLIEIGGVGHDDVAIFFDCYWSGAAVLAADTGVGSAFYINKYSDVLTFAAATTAAAGGALTGTGTMTIGSANGYVGIGVTVATEASARLEVQGSATEGQHIFELDQDDDDEPFMKYAGTSAADQTKNISTVNGDGTVEGPKNYSSTAGWQFEGMIRIDVNGVDMWMPYYSADVT